MNTKRFVVMFFSVLLTLLILTSLLTLLVDPLFQYHTPWFGLRPVITNERYQNAGIARNFDYDNVLIGNSMSENFQASWFENAWEGKTVKLTASGSHPLDWTYLLELMMKRESSPERVLIQFAPGDVSASPEVLKHELPLYLYNSNPFDDVNYLLNLDILLDFTIPTIRRNLDNDVPDADVAFVWDGGDGEYSKGAVLDNYFEGNSGDLGSVEDPRIDMVKNAENNLQLLLPYVEAMQDTEFIFWVPPYSILFWYDKICREELDSYRNAYLYIVDELLEYRNVTVYFWTDVEMRTVVADLDYYKDDTHYGAVVTNMIYQRIANEEGRVEKSCCQAVVNDYFDYIESYPFENLFIGFSVPLA